MNDIQSKAKDDGLELAKKMAEEEEGMGRRLAGPSKYVIPIIGVIWSFYQLSIASWLILDTVFIRAIHLGFALLIVFLNYPLLKRPKFNIKFLSVTDRIPVYDYVVAIIACFSAIYIAIDYGGINARYGSPIARDIIAGLLLIILLLEASRRVIGPALSVIGLFFLRLRIPGAIHA